MRREPDAQAPLPDHTRKQVLIVDDEPSMRQLIRRLVEPEFDVVWFEADDGTTALECLLHERIDLMLLDLTMRVMDGIETLEALRRSPAFSQLPVILLTGRPDEERVRRAIDLGIVGAIVKPFTRETVSARLRAVLPSAARAPARSGPELAIPAAQRALLVDQDPVVRAIAHRAIARVAAVEEADNEFAALNRCVSAPVDLVCVGRTSGLWSAAEMTRRIRATRGLAALKILAMVDAEDLDEARASGVFTAVVPRATAPDAFNSAFAAVLDQPTRTRFVLHPSSPTVELLLAWIEGRLARLVSEPPRQAAEAAAGSWATRHVTARVDIEIGAGAAWRRLSIDAPVRLALDLASADGSVDTDQLSGDRTGAFMARLAQGWSSRLVTLLADVGLPAATHAAEVDVTESALGIPGATATESRRLLTIGGAVMLARLTETDPRHPA